MEASWTLSLLALAALALSLPASSTELSAEEDSSISHDFDDDGNDEMVALQLSLRPSKHLARVNHSSPSWQEHAALKMGDKHLATIASATANVTANRSQQVAAEDARMQQSGAPALVTANVTANHSQQVAVEDGTMQQSGPPAFVFGKQVSRTGVKEADVFSTFRDPWADSLEQVKDGLARLGERTTAVGGFLATCSSSFCIISVSEMLDRTWFLVLVLAMIHPKMMVLIGCKLALFTHVIICAGLGVAVAQTMPLRTINFTAAGVYLFCSLVCFYRYLRADPEEKKEAEADFTLHIGRAKGGFFLSLPVSSRFKSAGKNKSALLNARVDWKSFLQCFLTVIIGEWGDRSQIVTMSRPNAIAPPIPAALGSFAACSLLVLSAILTGWLLSGQGLKEKTVACISCFAFFAFALLAFQDGLNAA